MKRIAAIMGLVSSSIMIQAQTAPDFSFTDVNGIEHNLYASLAEGKTVVLDFFFVDCAPCQYYTPAMEELYSAWGAGLADVEFWAFSDVDENDYIQSFLAEYNVNYTACGIEGGSAGVIDLFSGSFVMTGYPTYSVVCPDKTINWDIWPVSDNVSEIGAQIAECGATGVVTYDGPDQEILTGLIYPNPAQDEINIPVNAKTSGNFTVVITSLSGEIVKSFSGNTSSKQIQITIDNLQSGIYIVSIKGEGNYFAQQKIIKV
ncbi:MAG: T9SS type A sorting domain-containing protein [Chitinophagales bacterium]|nr:T9SS type A sorting domain-containing protein [Chitinophagales bacterium]